MPNFNTLIEEKLKKYSPEIQEIAKKSIVEARKLDAAKLATMLEGKVKSIARK